MPSHLRASSRGATPEIPSSASTDSSGPRSSSAWGSSSPRSTRLSSCLGRACCTGSGSAERRTGRYRCRPRTTSSCSARRSPPSGPDGSLYLTGLNTPARLAAHTLRSGYGRVVWTYSRSPANGMSPPSVGPDGSVYLSRSLGYLDAVNPAGDGRWTFFDGSIIDYAGGDPERRTRRRRRSAELRRAGQAARLERGHRRAQLPGRAADRRQWLPDRLHAAGVLGRQHDGLRRHGHVLSS